ncbi:MAG: hypothetical protein ACLPTJ_22780 [Solirubrobacteraceae bacterium]
MTGASPGSEPGAGRTAMCTSRRKAVAAGRRGKWMCELARRRITVGAADR